MKDRREPLQEAAVKAFLATPSKKASIEVGTGLGKSKIVIDILNELWDKDTSRFETHNIDTLILVPSERLRDSEWLAQFEKFGIDTKRIKLECYQTVYKWEFKDFPYVIADEADFSFTEEYSKFYLNNSYDVLICLTAYTDEKKREIRDKIAPVCFSFSTQQAQDEGMLNKTQFYQVNFELSQAKNVEVKTKKLSFKQSENAQYLYYDTEFEKALMSLITERKKANTAELLGEPYTGNLDKKEAMMKLFSRKRKEILHSLESSRTVTRLLLDKLQRNNSNNKSLIFSKLTSQIDQITPYTYHSKNKKTAVDLIQKLSDGTIKELGVCEALNRGVNLEGVNVIVMESYDGGATAFQQRHGRGTRLDVNQTLHFFILVPWVWDRTKEIDKRTLRPVYKWVKRPTQAKRWMSEMTSDFDISNLIEIDIEYKAITDTYMIPTKYDEFFRGG